MTIEQEIQKFLQVVAVACFILAAGCFSIAIFSSQAGCAPATFYDDDLSVLENYCWKLKLEKSASNADWEFVGWTDQGGIASLMIKTTGESKEEALRNAVEQLSKISK